MRKTLIALATSAGVALGSFGMTAAPAAAAMTAPQLATQAPDSGVTEVRHRGHRWHPRQRLVCHTHWKTVKVWRRGHWRWIKVPRQHCHWVWRGHRGW